VPVYFSIIIFDQYVDTNFVLFSISFLTGKTPIKRVKLEHVRNFRTYTTNQKFV